MTPADERRWRGIAESLRECLVAIKDQIQAVHKDQESCQNSEKPQPPVVVRSELQLPSAITNNYETDQEERQRIDRKRLKVERWAMGMAILTFFAVAATIVIATRQWQAMRHSNELTSPTFAFLNDERASSVAPVL